MNSDSLSLKTHLSIINELKNQYEVYGIYDDVNELTEFNSLNFIIKDGRTMIFSKLMIPLNNYIPQIDIDNFLHEDLPFVVVSENDTDHSDIIKFTENYLIFSKSNFGFNIDDIQHIIFKLSDTQLIQFKDEFKKCFDEFNFLLKV